MPGPSSRSAALIVCASKAGLTRGRSPPTGILSVHMRAHSGAALGRETEVGRW
jgi:hypothetical protein